MYQGAELSSGGLFKRTEEKISNIEASGGSLLT